MIERHVTFEVVPGKKQEFVRFFESEYRPVMSKSPGFKRVELLVEKECPNLYQMVIRFETQQDTDNWRASAAHEKLQPQLQALFLTHRIKVFEVVA